MGFIACLFIRLCVQPIGFKKNGVEYKYKYNGWEFKLHIWREKKMKNKNTISIFFLSGDSFQINKRGH